MAARQRFREVAADVAAGLAQFFQDVFDRRLTGAERGGQFGSGVHLDLIAQDG